MNFFAVFGNPVWHSKSPQIFNSFFAQKNIDARYFRILPASVKNIPVIIFPGDSNQFTNKADGILYLSLISGRNAEFLIGQHIKNSVEIKKSKLKIIPTGYILIDGGKETSVQQVSKTKPILSNTRPSDG